MAKRLEITEDDEEMKKLERAKKSGTNKQVVVKGLDDALLERWAKRGREGEKNAGRVAQSRHQTAGSKQRLRSLLQRRQRLLQQRSPVG